MMDFPYELFILGKRSPGHRSWTQVQKTTQSSKSNNFISNFVNRKSTSWKMCPRIMTVTVVSLGDQLYKQFSTKSVAYVSLL